jgi:hypothetical protein
MVERAVTPDVAAQQIRFALSRLRSRNAHHLFEEACRHFALARISRNILPATGPVAGGGDQGRDFETFHTFISHRLPGAFVTVEHNRPVVFSCTLQIHNLASKIKDDVRLIAVGALANRVYVFCEADVPVSRRHELVRWAQKEHLIALEIIDGTALAEQFAQSDVFWNRRKIPCRPLRSKANASGGSATCASSLASSGQGGRAMACACSPPACSGP